MRHRLEVYLIACILLLGVTPKTTAAPPNSFTTIDFPGAIHTLAIGSNDLGDIVGWYIDATGATHGFVLSREVFTTIDFPGADRTIVRDINKTSLDGMLYQANHSFTGFC